MAGELKSPSAPLAAGHAALAAGDWHEARERFREAIAAEPSAEAW